MQLFIDNCQCYLHYRILLPDTQVQKIMELQPADIKHGKISVNFPYKAPYRVEVQKVEVYSDSLHISFAFHMRVPVNCETILDLNEVYILD